MKKTNLFRARLTKLEKVFIFLISKLTKKEDNLKNKVNQKLLTLKMLLLMLKFHQKLNNQTIKVKEREMVTDQLKEFQPDIHSIEEVELVDKTDQEKKVEDMEMLVMPRMNLTRTNMNNLKVKSQPKPLKKFQLNKLNHKSHQNQLLLSTIKARVSISTLLPKRRLQSEVKSTLNGLRKKS